MYRVRFSTSATMANPATLDVSDNYAEWTHTDAGPTADAPRLAPSTTYYFQVKAIEKAANKADRDNLSGYGKVLAAKTAPARALPDLAPVEMHGTGGGADTVYLSWLSRGPGVQYVLRYTTKPTASVLRWKKVTVPVAGIALGGLTKATKYYFRVRVVGRAGDARSNYSATWSRTTAARTDSPGLNVVSFNVLKTGSGPSWASRRKAVAATISAQSPDVVSLQEATGIGVTGSSGTTVPQYADVLQLIGSRYHYVTTKGSAGTRLGYDATRLTVLNSNAVKLYTFGAANRYAVWAIFKDKRDGKQFFVLNTHLEPGSNDSSVLNDARVRQAEEVLGLITSRNPRHLPVILTGDLNSSRAAKPANGPYLTFTHAGLVDPLGRSQNSTLAGEDAKAEHVLDAEYNSFNHLEPIARRTSYPIGTNVDYVLVSGRIRVMQWRTVVSVDSTGRFVGTIPSDHNLVKAIVQLP